MLGSLLSFSSVMKTVGSVLLAILILLVMIMIHEFGHYLAGKALKFKINEFSVGFGPAIFKYTSKKSGELFSLRLIPLGGYCAFADEDGKESEAEESNAGKNFQRGKESKDEPPMPEIGEVFKDEIFSDEAVRTERAAVKTERAGRSERAEIRAQKRARAKEREKSGRFCDMMPWKRIIVLVSGAAMNYLLALVFIFLSFGIFGQLMIGTYRVEQTDEIAAEYCFTDEDIILKADGKSIYSTSDLMSALKNKQEGERVDFYISRITAYYADGTHEREKMNVSIQLRAATNFENSADTDRLWEALGIAKERDEDGNVTTSDGSPNYMVASYRYRVGFFQTIGRGVVYSFRIAGSIFKVLGELLTGALGIDSMGGPITTIGVASQVIARGWQPFFEITAYIGVNLAVFNLLPLPALDGSKVVFTAIEWVRGKPIARSVEAIIHTVGMLLLFGFAILVDILQLF
jgi:regulator of sigma E protease